MPTRFLSNAELERLEGFPDAIDGRDLVRFFALDEEDLRFVRRQHSPAGQLGVALQLCSLRWLGFVPDDLSAAPPEAIAALSGVLDVPPRAIFDYSVRPQTRREHRPLVRDHAGFRAGAGAELDALGGWLTEQALEHDRPSLLLGGLVAELRRRRIDRPAVDRLMRLVASARERAHEHTFQQHATQLTAELRELLDGLLVPDPVIAGRTRHAWLRSRPTTVSARAMHRELDKRAFLIETVGAERFDLTGLAPNRRAWLAQTGRQQTNQALARMVPERRCPVLMAFCVEALERVTDDAIEVFDRALGTADRAAERKREELERRGRRDIQSTVRRFIDLSSVVLEAHDSRADLLRLIERRIGIEQLLAALRLIGQLAGDKRRWLPGFSPSAFIDKQWRPHVVHAARGRFDRRTYELCAAYELRSALRAGRVWVPGSRRHADPASLLLPDEQWHQTRASFVETVERPVDGSQRLKALAGEQTELLQGLEQERDETADAHLADGDLVVDAAEDHVAGRLRKLIQPRLPEVDLAELLIEVDGWTGFTGHLTPLSGNRRRSADTPCLLYAVILAQATNLGLTGMAKASQFSYQQLEWAWEQLAARTP